MVPCLSWVVWCLLGDCCVYFMNCEMGSHGVVNISWFMVSVKDNKH